MNVDATELVAGLNELQHKSLPFAMAKTLTGCVQRGQAAVVGGLDSKFILRNNFVRQGIRFKPAEKNSTRIEADVHTKLDTGSHPDFMGDQEAGGEKVPWGGHRYIAVPTKFLIGMVGERSVIPQELRPRALLTAVGGRYTAVKRSGQIALRNQRRAAGFDIFVQTLADGHPAIMARYFTDRDAYPWYLLIPEAHIKPRLEMEQTVDKAVQAAFPELWAENWRAIMAKGLKIS